MTTEVEMGKCREVICDIYLICRRKATIARASCRIIITLEWPDSLTTPKNIKIEIKYYDVARI